MSSSVRSALDVERAGDDVRPRGERDGHDEGHGHGRLEDHPAHAEQQGRSQSPAGEAGAPEAVGQRPGEQQQRRGDGEEREGLRQQVAALGLAADEPDAAGAVEPEVGRDRDGDHGDERREHQTARGDGPGRVSTVRLAASAPTAPTTTTARSAPASVATSGAPERGRLQLRRGTDGDHGEQCHGRADRGADEDRGERGHAEEAGQSRRTDTSQHAQPQVAPTFTSHQHPGRSEQRAGRGEPRQADGRDGSADDLGQAVGVAGHGAQTGRVGLELLQLADGDGGVVAVGRGKPVELAREVLGLVPGEAVRVRAQLPGPVLLLEGDPTERLGRDEGER